MATSDLVNRLTQSLNRSRQALANLHALMEASRTAWVALRPSTLDQSVDSMQRLADLAAAEDTLRSEVLQQLATSLALKGDPTVSRLVASLPRGEGLQLRRAADALTAITKVIAAESRFGERLLATSRRIREAVFHEAAVREQGADGTETDSVSAYTRSATASTANPKPGVLINRVT